MQNSDSWNDVVYNLYFHYTKKELVKIYKFLKRIYKRAVKYNKREDLKVQENLSLIIKDTIIHVFVCNSNDISTADANKGEIEVAVNFINSMTPKKINQLNSSLALYSKQNYYRGLALIDFNEFLKMFKKWINNYEDVNEKEGEQNDI